MIEKLGAGSCRSAELALKKISLSSLSSSFIFTVSQIGNLLPFPRNVHFFWHVIRGNFLEAFYIGNNNRMCNMIPSSLECFLLPTETITIIYIYTLICHTCINIIICFPQPFPSYLLGSVFCGRVVLRVPDTYHPFFLYLNCTSVFASFHDLGNHDAYLIRLSGPHLCFELPTLIHLFTSQSWSRSVLCVESER